MARPRGIDLSDPGSPQVRSLGAGVEGAVYDFADGTVAKVWGHRHETELLLMQRFYAGLASVGLPFATPEILAIKRVNGLAVTHERKLPGDAIAATAQNRRSPP
jgi:hypothetical protein